jgi:micrococcal nuclease
MYTYNATVLRVIDGDTVQLNIDLGFRMYFKANCRLNGLNTKELNSKDEAERELANKAKQYLESLTPVNKSVRIESKSLDKYGRPLIELYVDDLHVNESLLKEGLAISYII